MQINFSPCLSNNKGWTRRLFFVGWRKGANVLKWDFPVRVVEPLKKVDMAPFLIQGAAAASQSLNTVGVNHAEGYLTEYKLVKYKLSHTWDDEEVATGQGQKEMVNYAETIPVSLHLIRLDEDAPVKESGAAKTMTGGGAMKKASEKAVIAEAASLPQPKRKEKRKAAQLESRAEDHTSEEEVSDGRRARKKKKAARAVPRTIEAAAGAEEEEEDLEPLLARRTRQVVRTPEQRASVASIVDRSEAVTKMSTELGLIMVSDESDRSGGRAKSPMHEIQGALPGEGVDQGSAEQGGASDEGAQFSAEDGAVVADSGRGVGEVNTLTPAMAAESGAGEAVLPRGNVPQGGGEILPLMPPTSVVTIGCVVSESAAESAAEVIVEGIVVGESAVLSGEGGTQALGDAEEGRATAFATSATEAGGEVRPATRQETVGADGTMASSSVVAMASGSGQQKDLEIDVAPVPSSAAAAGGESSGDGRRPLMEVLQRKLPEVPSVAALEETLCRVETLPKKLPASPTASYLDRLARCQDLTPEKTPEMPTERYHPEGQEDDGASDVDLEALVDGISTSLGVLKALAARARKQKYLCEAHAAFCEDLTARHKAREADLEEEVKNLKTALQASELNVALVRAEKDALAKVVSDAGVRAVADYKAGSDYKEDLEQYGARCYRVGLNTGKDFGERLSWVERAREAFEAAVQECRRRTNDACLDDVRFAQFQSGQMPSLDEGAGPSEQAP
ncbi:hypothetical protein Taro_027648 [Colocasia esculenta]|uniref:Uncharacterized protein n=1 Tax=Colocasia esculenta TaxID=4460 RepID=A0A843VGA0_COLES|nr:hypothetical protein [Colocasia esculenta]